MELPAITPSTPDWLMTEPRFAPRRLAHYETLFTLANGYAGVRGSLASAPLLGDPGFFVAGVYEFRDQFRTEIVNLPCWLKLDANWDGFDLDPRKGEMEDYWRALDLRQGLLFTRFTWRDDAKRRWRYESVRLLHLVEQHLGLEWGTITTLDDGGGSIRLGGTLDAWATKHGTGGGQTAYGNIKTSALDGGGLGLSVTTPRSGITVAFASQVVVAGGERRGVMLDDDRCGESVQVARQTGVPIPFAKYAVCYTTREEAQPLAAATAALRRLQGVPLSELVASHTRAWAARWAAADVRIEGDDRAQFGVRFNLFHLTALGQPGDDHVSLGAKGLHGNGYAGQVFWDTEIYLLPFFLFTWPAAARALLLYRHHFLADAAANAKDLGARGVHYPWNSSLAGREHAWRGWQEHVNLDIAYAVDQHVQATGDDAFYRQAGAELIIATAAYWPSRVERDPARGYVMRQLTGPDELHTGINNNTFTNFMVQWHLRRALRAVADLRAAGAWDAVRDRYGIKDDELPTWQAISDAIYINFNAERGFHEQFDGYFALPERAIDRRMTKMQYTGLVQHSFKPTKVAQQADTVMMYALFPHAFPAAVQAAAYRFYEPRCSHTSTLSRGMYARVAAQAGLLDEATQQFLLSLETDYGATAECDSGIHAACLGGNWQAAVMGFGGFSLADGAPAFDPRLPPGWTRLAYRVQWRGATIEVEVTPHELRLRAAGGPVVVRVRGRMHTITAAPAAFTL